MLLDRLGPPGRCSGCWRRPRRSQLRGQLRHDPIAPAGQGGSGVLSLRHFGLVLFIPWRVGAEESGAAKNGLRAQLLNNALTECLKRGRVNLLSQGRARATFSATSATLRAGAMLLEAIGPPGRCSGCGRDALGYGVSFATTRSHQLARGGALTSLVKVARARPFPQLPHLSGPARCCSRRSGRLGGAAAAGGGRDALSYGVSFATTRSQQLARGALTSLVTVARARPFPQLP